ncbi:MAG: hypothetical protein SCALA702_09370 [Melioribacteraceae bacterium]|nr:MAG: hypothetical protein SCALA702_09370 [Melioribacteraceae bacterium]
MSLYLLINILVIVMPLLLSFESKIKFYKKAPFFLASFFTVGLYYLVWDVIATKRTDWGFNPEYLNGIYVYNLPLEEFLFFITIPYACLFLYETIKLYLPERQFSVQDWIFNLIGILFFILAALFYDQNYTFTVLLTMGLFFIVAANTFPALLKSMRYWIFIVSSFLPFVAVNYILTSRPIVTYNPDAIWGIRLTTIPLEDFFYSFSMLSLYLLVYIFTGELWQKRKK